MLLVKILLELHIIFAILFVHVTKIVPSRNMVHLLHKHSLHTIELIAQFRLCFSDFRSTTKIEKPHIFNNKIRR